MNKPVLVVPEIRLRYLVAQGSELQLAALLPPAIEDTSTNQPLDDTAGQPRADGIYSYEGQ